MSSRPPFEVSPYTFERLVALIAEGSHGRSPQDIKAKHHAPYFETYLRTLSAQTLIVERNYIDRDFLEDYAAYYVRCFPDYRKACLRIHFFRSSFSEQDFRQCLSGNESALSQATLKESYLGFIVVKPLPQTVIGRTCLALYPENGTRHFPATRRFDAHLFGIELSVEHTLPFQEQDRVVAACATSALWSVFQATSRHFYHTLFSPIEITRAATHLLPAETRVLPNRGLSTHMMAQAIKSVNLEPYLIKVSELYLLKAAIYSYVRARIPLLLGVELIEDLGNGTFRTKDKHALTVVGFNLGGDAAVPIGPSQLRLRASRIDKIYVHDDQVGPFARMVLDGKTFKRTLPDGSSKEFESLTTTWPLSNNHEVRALPDMLLVPLYHKVRIIWDTISVELTRFDEFLTDLSKVVDTLKLDALEWDVYLTTVNETKAELLAHTSLSAAQKFAMATRPMPRFLWRATAMRGADAVFDLLFDATDVDTGELLIQCLVYEELVRKLFVEMASDAGFDHAPIKPSVKRILRWVKNNT